MLVRQLQHPLEQPPRKVAQMMGREGRKVVTLTSFLEHEKLTREVVMMKSCCNIAQAGCFTSGTLTDSSVSTGTFAQVVSNHR